MRAFWLPLLLSSALLCVGPARAELDLISVKSHQTAQTVLLDLELNIEDSGLEITRALLRGEVWLEVKIGLAKKRALLSAEPVGRLHVLQRLSYDPQQNVYQVTDVNQQERQTFPSLDDALSRLRTLNAIPVTRFDWLLPETEQYQGEVQARLYANPMPMAPLIERARSQPLDWQSGAVRWHLP